MSNENRNEKAEAKFVQFSPDSIELIADSAGHPNLPRSVVNNLAEDTSYRVRELIQTCGQILRHGKRVKLTKDDIDLALKWSDVPNIYGQQTESYDFAYLPELDIFHSSDKLVDLTKDYSMDKNVEVYSPMKLNIVYLSSDSEDKIKTEVYSLYYEKISQSLLSTVDSVVEVALTNLRENPKLQPLLSTFSVFLRNLVGLSFENYHVVTRIPLIFSAIMKNPYLNVEPELSSFMELLQYLLMNYAEGTMDKDIFDFVFRVSQLLCQIARHHSVADLVESMSNIITNDDQKITVKCRALIVLCTLSIKLLEEVTKKCWSNLIMQFCKNSDIRKNIYLKESLVVVLVSVLRYKIGQLDQCEDQDGFDFKNALDEGGELYYLCIDLVDFPVMRLSPFPQTLVQRLHKGLSRGLNDLSNELYWTIKYRHRPSIREKWGFSPQHHVSKHSTLTNFSDVFDCSGFCNLRSGRISFRIRNWKQKPIQFLRKKSYSTSCRLPSDFAQLCNKNLRPFSKCFLSHSPHYFCNPAEIIL